MKHLEGAISPLVDISTKHNALYDVQDFNGGIIRAVCANSSVGGCASGVSAGNYARVSPSDEWFRRRLATMDTDNVQKMFKESVAKQLLKLKQLNLLPKDGMVVAIDMHLIPRYDRTRGGELAIYRYKNGTKYFERYVTIQCVNNNIRLNLGCLPVPALASVPDMVRVIIQECLNYGIMIKLCLFDREFFSAENISNLNKLNIPYLMPCRNTHGVVEKLRYFATNPTENVLCNTLTGYNATASYNMVIAKRKRYDSKKDEKLPEVQYIGFATNLPWIDVIAYAVRWGIESGYAMIESMRAKTRSREPGARLFCFLYTLMMFNVWVMVKVVLAASVASMSRRKRTITQLAFKEVLRYTIDRTGLGPPN